MNNLMMRTRRGPPYRGGNNHPATSSCADGRSHDNSDGRGSSSCARAPPICAGPVRGPAVRRCVTLGLLITAIAAVMVWSAGTLHQGRGRPLRRPPHLERQREGFPLPPQVCSHQLLNPPVMRSSAISGPAGPDDLSPPPADGSLLAMTALWRSGVTCFDVDVVTLGDGSLVASHPGRLAEATKGGRGSAVATHEYHLDDLEAVRVAGADATSFPLLDVDLLPHYASLVRGAAPFFRERRAPHRRRPGQDDEPSSGLDLDARLRGPLLNLDLKQGPHLTRERLLQIVDVIFALDLHRNVAICVTPLLAPANGARGGNGGSGSAELDMLQILSDYNVENNVLRHRRNGPNGTSAGPDNVDRSNSREVLGAGNYSNHGGKVIPLGLVLRDQVEEDQDVDRVHRLIDEHYDSIRLLVPSFKFPQEWFRRVRTAATSSTRSSTRSSTSARPRSYGDIPMTVWTIDSVVDYENVKGMTSVSAVIANRPMEYHLAAVAAEEG